MAIEHNQDDFIIFIAKNTNLSIIIALLVAESHIYSVNKCYYTL